MPHRPQVHHGPEHQLQDGHLHILLAPVGVHLCDPALRRMIATRVGHDELLGLLNAEHIIVDQDLDGLSLQALIHIQSKVVEPHLAIVPDSPRQLAETEGPSHVEGIEDPSGGLPQDDLGGEIRDPALGIVAFMRPMSPKLIVLHQLGVLLIPALTVRASDNRCIQHATFDSEAALGEVLPGMPLRDRGPRDPQLAETWGERRTHCRMVADHFLRGPPLAQGVPKDLEQPRQILAFKAARPNNRAAVAIEDQHAIEPLSLNLHEILHIDKPDLMRRRRLLGAFSRGGETGRGRRRGMRLFVEGDQVPDGGMAIAIAQGVSGHFDAVMTYERMIIQQWKDLHDGVDGYPRRDGHLCPGPGGQADQAGGGKTPVPVIDHGHLNR